MSCISLVNRTGGKKQKTRDENGKCGRTGKPETSRTLEILNCAVFFGVSFVFFPVFDILHFHSPFRSSLCWSC